MSHALLLSVETASTLFYAQETEETTTAHLRGHFNFPDRLVILNEDRIFHMISKRNFAEILENFLTSGHIAAAFLKIWLDLMQNLLANKLTITKIHRKSEWEISLNLSVGYIV